VVKEVAERVNAANLYSYEYLTVLSRWGGGAWGMCGGEGEEECTHRCDRET